MADTEVIMRPNGRPYRARKVVAHALADADDWLSGVLVTGTHDRHRALALARELVRRDLGPNFEPVCSGTGWWRDGMCGGERCWMGDDEHGQAGVIFREIEEGNG